MGSKSFRDAIQRFFMQDFSNNVYSCSVAAVVAVCRRCPTTTVKILLCCSFAMGKALDERTQCHIFFQLFRPSAIFLSSVSCLDVLILYCCCIIADACVHKTFIRGRGPAISAHGSLDLKKFQSGDKMHCRSYVLSYSSCC
jgi:hypothetical protein